MENLPVEICLRIFCLLDHHNLATAQQVCRKWKALASDNVLWSSLFKERWGDDLAAFYAPSDSKSWKEVYEMQDRCDRVGLGLKIIREGFDYYLIHQGEIQRHLGSKRQRQKNTTSLSSSKRNCTDVGSMQEEAPHQEGLLDKILFFIGDLEVATIAAERGHNCE